MPDYMFLQDTALFKNIQPNKIKAMLECLGSYTRDYKKDECIFFAGDTTDYFGLVICGSVIVENDDFWGNKSVIAKIERGEIFAETYACLPGEELMVSVVAREKTTVLFISTARLLRTCGSACEHHNELIKNLLMISSQKNLNLSRRILHTSAKSIRSRLISYLSEASKQSGSTSFTVPYNRQQLADYLNVDRSAMCKELSKMQREGILVYKKNIFKIVKQ